MKNTVTESEFINSFSDYGRDENFSYEARKALFEYFTQYEEDCGIEIELDVIAICCEWSEYGTLQELAEDYGFADDLNLEDMDDEDEVIRNYIHDHTQLIEFDGGIIIACF